MRFIVFGLFASLISSIVCDEPSNCSPWLDMEKKLKAHHLQVACNQNVSCTGITCEFQEYGQEIHSSIHVNNCENPPSLELRVDAPKLKVNNWQKKFFHGDNFSVTDNFGGDFEMQKVNNTFVLGLTLQFHADKSHVETIMRLFPSVKPEIRYPLFENISIPIPACSKHDSSSEHQVLKNISLTTLPSVKNPLLLSENNILQNSNCTITNNSCPENELCQQLNTSTSDGICVCVPEYVRDKSGECIYSPTIVPSTVVPGNRTDPHHSETSNTSLLLTAILVPITVIAVLVGSVYATIRFRICQKMRRRLRVQVYEHVLLGQDDDEADDESLNPVV